MYKDFGTTLITGGTMTGKTTFLEKYLDEILKDGNPPIFIVDLKLVELVKYAKLDNVIYIGHIEDVEKCLINSIVDKFQTKAYVVIDEYAEIKFVENIHKKIKELMSKRKELNVDFIITSQLKEAMCQGMKRHADTIIHLNRSNW